MSTQTASHGVEWGEEPDDTGWPTLRLLSGATVKTR
jgi:hypothetical protein